MTDTAANSIQPKEEWLKEFMAEEQKRADALGLNLIEYYMQVEDGLLRPTMFKMLRHAKAHPKSCPPGCTFQRSFDELKKKYSVR